MVEVVVPSREGERLRVFFYGHGGSLPVALLGDPLLGAVMRQLLLAARTGIEPDKVELRLSKEYVSGLLEVYARLGILERAGGVYRPRIPVISGSERERLMEEARRLASDIVDYVKRHLDEIRRKHEESSLPARGFAWEKVSFLLVAGMLLDMYLMRGIHDEGVVPYPPPRPDGGRWYLWILDEGTGSRVEYWVNVVQEGSGGFARIQVRGAKSLDILLHGGALRIAAALAPEPKSLDELEYELGLPRERVEQILSRWLTLGLAERTEDAKFKLRFPVLLEHDAPRLLAPMRRMGRELARVVIRRWVRPLFFLRHELGHDHFDEWSYIMMIIYAAKCYAASRLVEEGLIADPARLGPELLMWAWCASP